MLMKHRRYIERRTNFDIDSDDDVASDEEAMNEDDFIELYRSHIKRKKLRKKIRANPDVRHFLCIQNLPMIVTFKMIIW